MAQRILFVFVASLLATCLLAQQTGQIVGVVRDSSGGVVPAVTVKAVEAATGFSRSTRTNADGQYVLPAMRPSRYEITAQASGFESFKRENLELLANQSLTVNIALQVGAVNETVTVSAPAVQVNTTSSTLSEVVDSARIVELPLNGRDAAKLATLVAGTAIISVSTETGQGMPGGLQLSSNGSRNLQVSYKLDGSSNTDPYFQENQSFPFPDALQEFSIQTSNYSAAQGNNAGAMVNVVTRSGTNQVHGGAFEFVRNREFNARNFFAPTRDYLKRNQYGVYGGGPVVLPGYNGRNKTFFFLGWQETQLRNNSNSLLTFAPTVDERSGNFSTCGVPCRTALKDPLGGLFPNNQIPVSRFDPASVKVNSFIPQVGGDGTTFIPRFTGNQFDQGLAKVDHQLTARDRLSARYFVDTFQNAANFDPTNLLTYRNPTNASRTRAQSAVLSWTSSISPTLLNDFHVGFNRVHAARIPPGNTPSMADLGVRLPLYPSTPSIAQIQASGFFSIGDDLAGKFPRTAFEVGNRTSWIHGHHSVQFGGEAQRVRSDNVNQFRQAGSYVFSGDTTGLAMADYFIGALRTFDQGTGEYKSFRVTYPSFFIQDDWRVSHRLTLNLGMRYEPAPPFHELRGRIEVFRPEDFYAGKKTTQFKNAVAGESFRGDPGTPADGTLGDYNNVAGRFGFAWDVFGNGKTSLRGGAGMFYDQHQNSGFNNGSVNAPPWNGRVSVTSPQGPFSNPYLGRSDFNLVSLDKIGAPDAAFPRPVVISTFDARQETPLTYNWNLTIEREIVPEWMARVAYVGSRALYGRAFEQLNPAVYIPGSPLGTDARRLYAPEIGSIDYYTQDRRASYHSLQLSLVKRFSHNFTVLANYTWSKTLDDFADFNFVKPWYFPNGDAMQYGPSDYDHRHRFVVSWVWDLPKTRVHNAFFNHVVNGWQWSGIGQYQTGSPFNIKSGRDNSFTGLGNDRAKLTGISYAAPAGADKRVWFNSAAFAVNDVGTFGDLGRNVVYGPNLYNFDIGFFKNDRITERVRVQFRAEMFNIFNQVNFANPVATITSAGFGTITGTNSSAGDPRIIQFGLKLAF